MCSIERMPSCTAKLMSLAQTSFWKSTKALARRSARTAAARRACRAERAEDASLDGVGPRLGRSEARGRRRRAPGRIAFGERARKIEGRVAGAGRPLALHGRAGLKSCSASSKTSLPRDCEKRCTDGVQPPDIRSASQATVRIAAGMTRGAPRSTRRRPSAPRICGPAATSMPAARAASGSGPSASSRRSAISATLTPALSRSSAAR